MQQTHVLPLAIAQFRKDWPFMAARLDSMRAKVGAGAEGPRLRGVAAPAAGVPELVTPPSNTGVNRMVNVARGDQV